MDRRALLAGGAAALAGCLPLRGEPEPPQNANYPRLLADIEWLPTEPAYRIRMVAGNQFTADNTRAVTVVTEAARFRETTWVGTTDDDGDPAQSFPLDVGDELVVPVEGRTTVRVVWVSPDRDRSVSLDALDADAQPTPTPTPARSGVDRPTVTDR
jgi:hypothetical protein